MIKSDLINWQQLIDRLSKFCPVIVQCSYVYFQKSAWPDALVEIIKNDIGPNDILPVNNEEVYINLAEKLRATADERCFTDKTEQG